MQEEFSLLVASLRQQGDEAGKPRPGFTGTVNWNEVHELATLHGVVPFVHSYITRLGDVSDEVRQWFSSTFRQDTFWQLTQVAEFVRINELFIREDIQVIPFKGWWLGQTLYQNLGSRGFIDVDLFIEKEDFARIKSILLQEGYSPIQLMGEVRDDHWLKVHNEYSFLKEYNGGWINFDIHWKLGPPKFGNDLSLADLNGHLTAYRFQGQELTVLDETATMALIVLHHGGKDLWKKLKHLNDLHLLLLKTGDDIDWPWVISICEKYYSEKLLYVGLGLSRQLLGSPIPQILQCKVEAVEIRQLIANRLKMFQKPASWWKPREKKNRELFFRLRTRTNNRVRWNYTWYAIRGYAISLVPVKYHRYFFNKRIRKGVS